MKPIKLICLLGVIIAAISLAAWLTSQATPQPPKAITEAKAKAETATAKAIETETKTVEAELKVIKQRAIVKAAKEVVRIATEERIAANITLDSLPAPIQKEIHEILDYISTLETQVWLEVMRGDSWKETSHAWQEATEANKELAEAIETETQAIKKAAWWKGIKIGSISGLLAILLLVLL